MAPRRKSTLPKPLPDGFILTDTVKKKWRLGKIIGQGGFGLIYLGIVMSTLCTHPVHPHSATYVYTWMRTSRITITLSQPDTYCMLFQEDTTLIDLLFSWL